MATKIYQVKSPEGEIIKIRGPEGASQQEVIAKAQELMATHKTSDPQPGFMQSVANLFTGADRETRATQELPELQSSGVLQGLDIPDSQKAALSTALLTMTNPEEIASTLRAASPLIGIQQDEKGNLIVANNRTGARAVINKPGVSGLDLMQGAALTSAFAPTGGAATAAGAGALRQAAVLGGASALTQAGIEAGQAAAGGEFNPGEVAVAGALGGAVPLISAGASAAGKAIGGSAQKADDAVMGRLGAALADTGEKVPEQEMLAAIQAQQAQGINTAKEVAQQVTAAAGTSGKRQIPALDRLASEVMPDETILQAAERLGIKDALIPSQYSKSQAYREIEQGLASIPGSQLNVQQKEATRLLAEKADDFIKQYGGSIDKAAVSEQFKDQGLELIASLEKQSDDLYTAVAKAVPMRAPVQAQNSIAYLKQKAADLGGEEFLSNIERNVLTGVSNSPTYGRLDLIRKQVGEGFKGRGPFKDAELGSLSRLYASLSDDQHRAAESMGAGDLFSSAKQLVASRKMLEDDMVALLGKDLSGAITAKTKQAIRGLASGDYKKFDQVIARVPEEMRQRVVATSLNDAFTIGGRSEQLGVGGFVDWYANLKRNNGAMIRLHKYMPNEAMSTLEDIYQVARGMREASKERIPNGRIGALLEQFAQEGGMLAKLWGTGKKIAAAEGVANSVGVPGAGAASVITRVITKEKTPIIKAADEMMASPQFKNAIGSYVAKGGKAVASEAALIRSKPYQEWLGRAPEEVRKAIGNVGFLSWLASSNYSHASSSVSHAPQAPAVGNR